MNFIPEILILVASMMKAIADTVDHHFDSSIFKRMNRSFWDRDISSVKAKRIFGYKIDAWHIANSLMIVLLLLAVIFHTRKSGWMTELILFGIAWNVVFNVFYNNLLRKFN